MVQVNDLSRSVVAFEASSTLVAVIEMGAKSWLVAATVPGVERHPLKKLEPDAAALFQMIARWQSEAVKSGRMITRVVVAFEAGRDGFWLARWLIARDIEVHVIHSASVAVSRERKRAKTDRLDAAMLMRVLLGWLRGERGHCGMVAIPTLEEEDARRPSRERESLVAERSRIINRMKSALARLGIRGFKPHLRKASHQLERLCTPEGAGLPPNTLEEFRRDQVLCILEIDDATYDAALALADEEVCQLLATDVMIIEDEILIAAELEGILHRLGHTVSSIARTRKQAVRAAERNPPKLILSDVQLADGSSGLDAVRDIIQTRPIATVFITAYPERLLTGLGSEPTYMVTKPFRAEQIKAVISQVLFFDTRLRWNLTRQQLSEVLAREWEAA